MPCGWMLAIYLLCSRGLRGSLKPAAGHPECSQHAQTNIGYSTIIMVKVKVHHRPKVNNSPVHSQLSSHSVCVVWQEEKTITVARNKLIPRFLQAWEWDQIQNSTDKGQGRAGYSQALGCATCVIDEILKTWLRGWLACGGVGGGVVERVWRRGETLISSTPPSTDNTPLMVWVRAGSDRKARTFWKTPGIWKGHN